MDSLEHVSAEVLQTALDRTGDAKAAKRLMIALAYKDGVSVATMSDRYAVPKSTIYYWLERFEERSVEDAATDEHRPGRPPKLSAAQRKTVEEWLENPPHEYGYDRDSWTSNLLRDRIESVFGVAYSEGHVRRFLRE